MNKTLRIASAALAAACFLSVSPAALAADSPDRPLSITQAYPEESTGKWDKKALKNFQPVVAPSFQQPTLPVAPDEEYTTIFGPATASQSQMVRLIRRINPNPVLPCTVSEIVRLYYEEAGLEGIRPDVALCQAIKETGAFGYGGDVSPDQNNYCGLGATGNREPGHRFDTPQLGVRAHIQHLLAYAGGREPKTDLVDPRFLHVKVNHPEIFGHCQRWIDLNNKWAVPGERYGQEILDLWKRALAPDGSRESMVQAERMVRDHPESVDAHIYRGIARYMQKSYELARQDFEFACQKAPKSINARYDLALALEGLKQPKEALDAYDELLDIDKTFWMGWYNRGMIHMSQKKYKAAVKDFQKALNLNPQMADAQNAIGAAHVYMKKYDEAWKDFGAAIRINSRNRPALSNRVSLFACMKMLDVPSER